MRTIRKFQQYDLTMTRALILDCEFVVIALLLLGSGERVYGAGITETGRVVYLPLMFHAEAGPLRTTACLQVIENVYGQTAWWQMQRTDEKPSEQAFAAVLKAIRSKDRSALYNLSHSIDGRDPKEFEKQASAFIQQFESIELLAVPRSYEVDGLTIFFSKLRLNNEIFFAPFIFEYDTDGAVRFLPYRTELLTYRLVEDWFSGPWGPATIDVPGYCTDLDIKRARYRISLVPSRSNSTQNTNKSYLFLRGAAADSPGELSALVGQVERTLKEMNVAPEKGLDQLLKHMTTEGGNRLKAWFASAEQTDRARYMSSITKQRAFFFLDASPLIVVYTKSATGDVQIMYFTFSNNDLLWTNSSHVTLTDRVFKTGPVYDSSLLSPPFSNLNKVSPN